MHARVEERLFSQAALEHLIFVNGGFLENLGVSLEAHLGALDAGLADDLELVHDFAAFIALEIDVLAVADLDLEPLGESVDDRSANAVETARNLVSAAAEFAARVEDGKDDRDRGKSRLAVDANGDAASVVGDADDVARLNHDVDLGAVARERLVDRVVDNFIDQMVQAARTRGADIHTRAFSDRLESLEHLNFIRAVFLFNLGDFDIFFISFDILYLIHVYLFFCSLALNMTKNGLSANASTVQHMLTINTVSAVAFGKMLTIAIVLPKQTAR